jgi:hypothetical protein
VTLFNHEGRAAVTAVNPGDAEMLNALQARAQQLGCFIATDESCNNSEIDLGPYVLRDAESGKDIWGTGLPVKGIAEALDCFERELQLPPGEDIGAAWADFGAFLDAKEK